MHSVTPWNAQDIAMVIDAHKTMPGAMLPVLHGIQDRIGFIPAEAVAMIADGLNVSRAEVHGVITYYHHFRQEPAAAHLVQICRAEACQARGADALVAHAQAQLGCDFHETSKDGHITLEAAFCLGQCAVGPNIAIGDKLHARITPDRFDQLINPCRGAA